MSFLSLIDIDGLAEAASQMQRVLRLGGTLLIANLTSFNTAGLPGGWKPSLTGKRKFCIDHYLKNAPFR